MNAPVVSVLLPVYNSGDFLTAAIRSVLEQSYSDFELLIINDGSTDGSEDIIRSFSDPRIICLKNDVNKGLIFSLNHGIEMARGKYIARMDADDICLPDRFAKQVSWLEANEKTAVVASVVSLIDQSGSVTGDWPLDRKTVSYKDIRKKMPFENCLAHPSVMIRTSVLKKLRYKTYPKHMEDYDLWLRILNRGYRIEKINEPLLLYRMHDTSVTGMHLKNRNPFLRLFRMKLRLLLEEFFSGHFSFYFIRIKLAMYRDFFTGTGKFIRNLFN